MPSSSLVAGNVTVLPHHGGCDHGGEGEELPCPSLAVDQDDIGGTRLERLPQSLFPTGHPAEFDPLLT